MMFNFQQYFNYIVAVSFISEQAFRPILITAYEETLKPYHGMILRALISVC
jgi:hypothetical protein